MLASGVVGVGVCSACGAGWPGTSATLADRELKVLRGRPAQGSGKPGEIIKATGDGLLVGTGDGAYLVEEVQLPSRRPMPARQLLP